METADREQAESLKNAGNDLYKNGNLYEAIRFYESAIQVGLTQDLPTYLSNLSAAYYESGYYEKSLDSIDRAFELLQNGAAPEAPTPLDVKLRIRECRCLLHIQEFDQLLDAIQEVDQAVYDSYVEFGVIEDAALHSLDQLNAWDSERARKFVPLQPRYRPRHKRRRTAHHSNISHDTAISALTVSAETKEERSSLKRNSRILITNLLPQQAGLSFFYGGVGDPRHALATMIDVFQQDPGDLQFSLSIALVDESASVIARSIILFFMLEDLSKRDLDNRSTDTIELLSLLHYTYIGAIMPAWLHEKLLSIVRLVSNKLCSGLGVPPWLVVSLDSIDKIIPVFKYWIRGAAESICIKDFMDMQKPVDCPADISSYPNVSTELKKRLRDSREQARIDIKDAILHFTDAQLNHILINKVPNAKRMSLKEKKTLAYDMFATDEALDQLNRKRYVPDGLLMEYSTFYQGNLKMLYSPEELDFREPKLASLLSDMRRAWTSIKTESDSFKSKPELLQAVRKHIENNWVINVTLVEDNLRSSSGKLTIQQISFDPFAASQQLVSQTGIRPLVKPFRTFDYTAAFFLNAARSLKAYGHRFLFECMVEEPHDVLEKIARSPEESNFDLFDRVYFQAPPDLTGGLLAQVVDVMTVLKPLQHAFMASKIIHNESDCDTVEDLLSETTLLPSFEETQRYLGIGAHGKVPTDLYLADHLRVRPMDPANVASIALTTAKTRLVPLQRHELTEWLYQIFLRTAIPTGRKSGRDQQQRLNLHSFFRLLIYLQSIDFPAHWLSSVLDDIIQNRVSTKARHSSSKDSQKPISMTPFSLEMEAALTIWFPLLTFGITAVEFPDAGHVRRYTLTLTPTAAMSSTSSDMDADADAPTLALWFSVATTKRINVDLGKDIIGSHNACKSVRLLSSFDWDPDTQKASFWANESSMELLLIQNFSVRMIRTDRWETVTLVVSVKHCIPGAVLSDWQEPV